MEEPLEPPGLPGMVPCARASRTPPILATVATRGEVFDYANYQRQRGKSRIKPARWSAPGLTTRKAC